MSTDQTNTELTKELDRIGTTAQRILQSSKQRLLLKRSINTMLLALPFGPWLMLVVLCLANLNSATLVSVPWYAWVCAALLPSLAFGVIALIQSQMIRVSRQDALAWVDRTYDLEDRLVTGDEFLRLSGGRSNPFVLAAIGDAVTHAQQTTSVDLPTRDDDWQVSRWASAAPVMALLLILASLLIEPAADTERGKESAVIERQPPVSGSSSTKKKQTKKKSGTKQKKKKQPTEKSKKKDEQSVPGATRKQKPNDQQTNDQIKETSGKTEAGQSADAASASGASQSKGVPSRESQTSKSDKNRPKKKKRKKKKKPQPKNTKSRRKPTNEPSGSTAGRGNSGGSSRNPVSTPWASKDKVAEVEQDAEENDDDVDDEETNSEARGGVQPNLRDRRPPVSRDLTIGFGNRSNPDANGRGGPGQQKKSRGTASLVLGVPIPDQVKGQPNPGKTKITQERVEPKAEDAAGGVAQQRNTRKDSFGFIPRHNLEPWMRDLVRKYFLSIRSASEKKPTT